MTILQYIPSINASAGGPSIYMKLLAKELGQLCDLHILTHKNADDVELENCKVHYLDDGISSFLKNKKYFSDLLDHIQPAIVHINCCWLPENYFIQKWAQKRGIKIVITPHGAFDPTCVQRNYYTKKLPALILYQKRAIRQADYMIATSEVERKNIQSIEDKTKIKTIPTGIDINQIKMRQSWNQNHSILCLSRIHPIKGLENLIDAVNEIKSELTDYQILIAGNGDENYIKTLQDKVNECGLSEIIKFIGAVYNAQKWELYQNSDFFISSSLSENFGLSIAEALASGTPVITTKGTPWQDIETYHCGKWIDVGSKPLSEAIQQMIKLTDAEREAMGQNARKLIEEKYSAKVMAEKIMELYKSL